MTKLLTPLLSAALLLAPAFAPPPASAQSLETGSDAVSFGSGVEVPAGAVVRDAVSFGGDTIVHGTVTGDAVSFGGSVILEPGARVEGDATSFGGAVVDHRAGTFDPPPAPGPIHGAAPAAAGPLDGLVGWVKDTARSAMAHALLFLLGLLMIGIGRDRLGALQVTMIRDAAKTVGWGALGYLVGGVAAVLLALTVVGIPVAICVALVLPVATYVGLAAAATVIGAALPIPQLQRSEVAQLGAGVAVLFLASLVPVFGGLAVALAACLGFGAVLRTRLSATPPTDLPDASSDPGGAVISHA